MIRFFPSYRRRTLEREEGEEFSLEWKASFARTRAFLPAWNGGFVGRLAWIQCFNDVKTRGGAKARPVISSLPVSSRNFICLIGEGEGRRGETPLESLERSCTRSLSLSLCRKEREFIGVILGPGCSVSRQLLINQTGITRYRAGWSGRARRGKKRGEL